ncbi:putative thioredoxin-disulfide reductase [Mycoplasma sp. CAG:776]|nr:putative thioredoxin-disulfide reductase [Mycoplasma sp. CAG:776]
MYDLIIIGMGISGVSAGIYAKRAGLKVLLLEGSTPGGTLNQINKVDNYPGIISVSGPDFAYNLFEEVNKMQIEYKLEKVTDVILDEIKVIKTTKNVYEAKNLLIASGRRPKLLGLADEEKFLGKGISTCALCDGTLYKNQDIAVIGGGSSALSEALYLSNIVNKVYLIHRREEFRGEDTLIKAVKEKNNIELILNNEVKKLKIEEDTLKGVILKDDRELLVKGIFIYVGFIPNTDFLVNTDVKLENGYIVINAEHETNIKGIYASGDVTKKEIYQLINAASEGAEAVIYLSK